jgi:hypothetical protein
MINSGSIGQPRDGDPRAAYAVYDPDAGMVPYHRVAYDVASAQKKIRDAGLPPILADRALHHPWRTHSCVQRSQSCERAFWRRARQSRRESRRR